MLSAAVALLELAGGGGEFDSNGNLEVTEDHVQAGLLLVTFSALAVSATDCLRISKFLLLDRWPPAWWS